MTLTGVAVEQEWRRLERRSIWIAPLRPLGGLLLTGLVIVTVRGWGRAGLVEALIGLVVAVAVFALSAWYWATTRYRVTDTHVELRHGLLVRRHRQVARDRLRTVDLTADVTHRLAGLAVVAIGTGRQGGESDDELKLDSVATAEAGRLREMLLDRGVRTGAPRVDPDAPLAAFDASWVRLAPLSLLGLAAVGVVAAALGQVLRSLGDDVWTSGPLRAAVDWFVHTPLPATIVGGVLVLVVLNALLSTVLYVLVFGGYTLHRTDDGTLRLAYGLLTRRSVTIEGRRIRGVRIEEPLLLRLGGGAKAKVVAAGLGQKDRDGREKANSDLLMPTAPRAEVSQVAAAAVGVSPLAVALRRHPVRALRVLLVHALASLVPAAVLAVLALPGLVPSWVAPLLLLLLVPAAGLALLEYRNLGHAPAGEFLVARGGSAIRRTTAVRRDGIIAWRFRRTVFQRGLLTATAAVAAGKGEQTIRYADPGDVLVVARDTVPGLLEPFLEPVQT